MKSKSNERLFSVRNQMPIPSEAFIRNKITISPDLSKEHRGDKTTLEWYVKKITQLIIDACRHSSFNRDYISFTTFHRNFKEIRLMPNDEFIKKESDTASLTFNRNTQSINVNVRYLGKNEQSCHVFLSDLFHEFFHSYLFFLRNPPSVAPACQLPGTDYAVAPFRGAIFSILHTKVILEKNFNNYKNLLNDFAQYHLTRNLTNNVVEYLNIANNTVLPPRLIGFPYYSALSEQEIESINAGHMTPMTFEEFIFSPSIRLIPKYVEKFANKFFIWGALSVCDSNNQCDDRVHPIILFLKTCFDYQKHYNFALETKIDDNNIQNALPVLIECDAVAKETGLLFPKLFPELYKLATDETSRWLEECSFNHGLNYVTNVSKNKLPTDSILSVLSMAFSKYLAELFNFESAFTLYQTSGWLLFIAVAGFIASVFREEISANFFNRLGYTLTSADLYRFEERSVVYQMMDFGLRTSLTVYNTLSPGVMFLHDVLRNGKQAVVSLQDAHPTISTGNKALAVIKSSFMILILYTIGIVFLFRYFLTLPLHGFLQNGFRGWCDGVVDASKETLKEFTHCIPGATALRLNQQEASDNVSFKREPSEPYRSRKRKTRYRHTEEAYPTEERPAPSRISAQEQPSQTWALLWNAYKATDTAKDIANSLKLT